MLVLSRRAEEQIVIDGNVKLRILSVSATQVRIGIEAPPDIKILRGELVPKLEPSEEQAPDGSET